MKGTELLEKLNRLDKLADWNFNVNEFYDYSGFAGLKSSIARGHCEDNVEEILEILEEIGDANLVIDSTESAEYQYDINFITYFPKHNLYLETTGEYLSHHGYEFEKGFGRIVQPVSKTVITFEEVYDK